MKKIILFVACLALISGSCFAAKKRVKMADGSYKMVDVFSITEFDKFGNKTKFSSYDGNERTETWEFNDMGLPLKDEDQNELEYDDKGHLIKKTSYFGGDTYYQYDENGVITYIGSTKVLNEYTDPYALYENGKIVFEKFDYFDTKKYIYNEDGNLVKMIFHTDYSDSSYENIYEYDDRGLLVRSLEFEDIYDKAGHEILYDYDDRGNCIYIEDLRDGSQLFEFDENNRLIHKWAEDTPAGEEDLYYEYDDRGNVVTIKRPLISFEPEFIDEDLLVIKKNIYTYGDNGAVLKLEAHDYNVSSIDGLQDEVRISKWDDRGNLIYEDHTNPRGELFIRKKYQYNDKNLLIEKDSFEIHDYKNGTYVYSYEFHDNGQISRITEFKL